jgi:chromosome segregation ATPase
MLVEKSSNNLHNKEVGVNGTFLVTVIAGLLGGGGAAALIQIVLLPRTMARTRADTTQVLVGTATETVALVRGELGRSQVEAEALRSSLTQARGRMEEQNERIVQQRRKIERQDERIADQEIKIGQQDDRIAALTAETLELQAKITILEQRVRAATQAMGDETS